jgi:hypothetical protein
MISSKLSNANENSGITTPNASLIGTTSLWASELRPRLRKSVSRSSQVKIERPLVRFSAGSMTVSMFTTIQVIVREILFECSKPFEGRLLAKSWVTMGDSEGTVWI